MSHRTLALRGAAGCRQDRKGCGHKRAAGIAPRLGLRQQRRVHALLGGYAAWELEYSVTLCVEYARS
jgi:hypothetical protein